MEATFYLCPTTENEMPPPRVASRRVFSLALSSRVSDGNAQICGYRISCTPPRRVFHMNALNYNKSHYSSIRLWIVVAIFILARVIVHRTRDVLTSPRRIAPRRCIEVYGTVSETRYCGKSAHCLRTTLPSISFLALLFWISFIFFRFSHFIFLIHYPHNWPHNYFAWLSCFIAVLSYALNQSCAALRKRSYRVS